MVSPLFPDDFPIPLCRSVVDTHVHPRMSELERISPEAMAAELVADMDRAGVAVAGILGRVLPPRQNEDFIRTGNDYTIAMVRAFPDRLYGLCYVNPSLDPAWVRDELDRCLSQPEMRGVKQEIDVNARDPRMEVVMERAMHYRCPVLFHCLLMNPWSFSEELKAWQAASSDPNDIAWLAQAFPDVPIQMAHLEGVGIAGIDAVASLPNVMIDTSGYLPFTGSLEYAIECVGADRIIFGTDWPGRGYPNQLGRIYGAGLTEEEQDKILFRNARSFWKLDDSFAATSRRREGVGHEHH